MMDSQLEHQMVNYNIGATSYATAGATEPVTQSIIQGSATSQRDGSAIVIREIEYREVLNLLSATIGAAVRTLIVLDTQNTGVVPAITDVLDNAQVQSPYNVNTRINKRFRILYDVMHGLAVGGPTQEVTVHWRYTKMIQVKYNGTTNAAASNGRNALFVYHITDLGVAPPTYKFGMTLRYTDA